MALGQAVGPDRSFPERDMRMLGLSADRLVAVIPAYNEDKYIASLVLKARRQVDVVVVVDDGSSDQTAALAREAGAVVIVHEGNQGKGVAVRSGLTWAVEHGAEAVVLLDGDGQHRPDEIQTLLRPVLDGDADVVVGSRFLHDDARRNVPGWRKVGQRALNMVTAVGSGHGLTDSQSGFRVLSGTAARLLSDGLQSDGFSVESEMQFMVRDHGLRTLEIPIVADYDIPLKRNPVLHGLEVLNGVIRLISQARPLLFFGVPGMALVLIGVALGYFKVVEVYNQNHELAVGFALLTAMLVLAGLLGLCVAIILHAMRAYFMEFRRRN